MLWLYLFTFVSGFAALVYEMLWTRQLSLVLGSTTAAISTVVAAYMGGLALGSALVGRRADQWRRHVASYALLELGIGITALAIMAIIPTLELLYPAINAATSGSAPLLGLVRFLLVFALLLIPTCLMGGTYPVLVKAVTRHAGELGSTAGKLYAANTLGAVVGCFAAGVYLLGALGVNGTGYLAVGLNIAIAAAAWLFDRRVNVTAAPKSEDPTVQPRALPSDTLPETLSPAARSMIAFSIAASGFVALGYEIVWSRALGLVIGHSIYAFTFVLSTYLAGLALGGYLASLVLDRMRQPVEWFIRGLLALAIFAGATLYVIPQLPFYDYHAGVQPVPYILSNLLACSVMLLPPTLLLGALLPLAIKIYTADLRHAGAQIGTVYAWNTVGSIGGSLATGFLLIPWFGTQPTFLGLVIANLLVALCLSLIARPQLGRVAMNTALIAVACYLLYAAQGSPLLRNKSIARALSVLRTPLTPLFYSEDQVASVILCRTTSGMEVLVANGDPMTHMCIETTWMAHLPLAIAREPRDMLVLCLGMGNTVLSALQYDVNVTAVEISPAIVAAVRRLHGDALHLDEGDRLVVADGRNSVLVAPEKFDVITADPPPPLYSAGSVNFHTTEFYEACRAHLRPGGVVCQWIPFRHCSESEYKMLMRSFYEVFPRMAAWTLSTPGGSSGLYLIAWGDEVDYDAAAIRERMSTPLVRADADRFDKRPLETVLPYELLRDEQVARFCGDAPIMTDGHPWLEFPLFRNAGSTEHSMTLLPILEFLAKERAAAE